MRLSSYLLYAGLICSSYPAAKDENFFMISETHTIGKLYILVPIESVSEHSYLGILYKTYNNNIYLPILQTYIFLFELLRNMFAFLFAILIRMTQKSTLA